MRGYFNSIQLVALRTTGWTGRSTRFYRFRMARRHVYDPLEPTTEPRWYVVRNMHQAVLEARPLPLGADLKRAFVAAILEYIDAGWRLGDFSSRSGTFFCTKDSERRMVEISPSNPGPIRPRFA
jgi:hypothetical protein